MDTDFLDEYSYPSIDDGYFIISFDSGNIKCRYLDVGRGIMVVSPILNDQLYNDLLALQKKLKFQIAIEDERLAVKFHDQFISLKKYKECSTLLFKGIG